MNWTKLFIGFLLISSTLAAQTNEVVHLWPQEVPNESHPKTDAMVMPSKNDGVTRITNVWNPNFTVFQAENNTAGIAVIVCPGGGYERLSIDKEGYEIAQWLNDLGYTAFVLEYRVPDNQLGALNDVQRAIRMIRNDSEKYHINPDKIGVIGFSAGGSLSARIATNYDTNSYESLDTIDTASSRPNFVGLIYPAYLDFGPNNSITEELNVNELNPPFFIFGTADDSYGNSCLVMAKELREKKGSVELHFLAEGGHGYGLRAGNAAAEAWPKLFEIWLRNLKL